MKKLLCALASVSVLAAFAAKTIKVDASGEWEGSVTTLEAAFAALSGSGDTILVRPGTYYLTKTLTNTVSNLTLKSADMDGNTDRANTIIDGSQSEGRAFYNNSNATPTIEGFTFRNFSAAASGGVLYLNACGAWKVLDCEFADNQVSNANGGAIYSYVCSGGIISNCVFRGNRATGAASAQGGAVYTQQNGEGRNDRCNIFDCAFSNNWAQTTGASHDAVGGAVCAIRCMYIYNSVFEDNWVATDGSSSSSGGQIYVGCYSHLENCQVSCRSQSGSSKGNYYGSTLYLRGSASTKGGQGHEVVNCTFGPFPASANGYGIVAAYGLTNTFDNCRFLCADRTDANLFFVEGGAGAAFRNCLIEMNNGSLAWFYGAKDVWRYENCTFINKKDDGAKTLSTYPTYVNCLGNMPLAGASELVTNCLFTARLVDCQLEDTAGGRYYPRKESPAYDGGFDLGWAAGAKDAFGRTRVVGAAVDIGAVERQDSDADLSHVRVVADPAERIGEWASAFTNVQEAVDSAIASGIAGCTIWIKAGTYALDAPVALTNGSITLTSRTSVGGELNHGVVLDGQGKCRVLTIDNKSTYDIVVEGLTVMNGNSDSSGGGIYADGLNGETAGKNAKGCVVLRDCFVTNCVSTGNGGGLYAAHGVIVTNCVFVGNTAVGHGGGAFSFTYWANRVRDGQLNLCPAFYGCQFLSNALSTSGMRGGGLCTDWSALIDHCLFVGNNAPSGHGGGASTSYYNWMRDCTFVANLGASYGRNLQVNADNSLFERSSFSGATGGFGSVWNSMEATFYSCAFTNNTTQPFYGQSPAHFRNCLFTGTPEMFTSTIDAQNCTFADGLSFRTDVAGKVIANNCIIAGTINFANVSDGRMFYATNSCFQAAVPNDSANVVVKDCFRYAPQFVDKAGGDCHVKGSVFRDKGIVLPWMTPDAVDLDGNPRLVNMGGVVNAPDALPDLGCYEAQEAIQAFVLFFR